MIGGGAMGKKLWWMATLVLMAAYFIIRQAPATVAATAQRKNLVVIDPGHGGWDPGAVRGAVYEKTLTLAVAMKVGEWLLQHNIRVYYTRTRDTALASTVLHDLNNRSSLANRVGAALFVSIHVNIEATGTVAGPIVYYHKSSPASYTLARQVSQSLAPLSGRYRPPRPIGQWVLARSHMPAINVEVGFLSHNADAARMQSVWYQSHLAATIGQGILGYLNR